MPGAISQLWYDVLSVTRRMFESQRLSSFHMQTPADASVGVPAARPRRPLDPRLHGVHAATAPTGDFDDVEIVSAWSPVRTVSRSNSMLSRAAGTALGEGDVKHFPSESNWRRCRHSRPILREALREANLREDGRRR